MFPALRRRYPSAFTAKIEEYDDIFLDANALLYPLADVSAITENIAKGLLEVSREYATVYKGRVHIYLDGPPHIGKTRHQRSRRFLYLPESLRVEEDGISLWTSSNLTPGTQTMQYLDQYIEAHKDEYGIASFSPSSEPGEGEHKLIRDIKLLPLDRRVAIVGKDADLILLGMSLEQNIHILRHWNEADENTFKATDDIITINCPQLKSLIMKDMKTNSIWNFIIPTFLVGNDFVPPIPELSDIYKSLPRIIKMRKKVYDVGKGEIIWKGIYELCKSLIGIKIPDRWVGDVMPDVFDSLYYHEMPYMVKKDMLVKEWIVTIEWIFQYYHNGLDVASRAWQFRSSYAPTLHTILDNWKIPDLAVATKQYPPLLPAQALALAVPTWLRSLLPEKTRKAIEQYPQYYPYSFKRDPMDHPILPFIPYTIGLSLPV